MARMLLLLLFLRHVPKSLLHIGPRTTGSHDGGAGVAAAALLLTQHDPHLCGALQHLTAAMAFIVMGPGL
jgi:hypothetical protein